MVVEISAWKYNKTPPRGYRVNVAGGVIHHQITLMAHVSFMAEMHTSDSTIVIIGPMANTYDESQPKYTW